MVAVTGVGQAPEWPSPDRSKSDHSPGCRRLSGRATCSVSELPVDGVLAALGMPAPDELAPVAGGQDTAIWRVRHGRAIHALRLFRAEQHDASRREIAALEAARAGGVPTPTVERVGEWRGRPVVLLGWCGGTTLLHAIRTNPARLWLLGTRFGATLARIHTVAAPEALGSVDAWIAQAGEDRPSLQAELRRRRDLRPSLLHLDYHPLNVLCDGDRITAVLDWVNSRAGDPRADVARTTAILRASPAPGGGLGRLERVTRWLLDAAFRRGYTTADGLLTTMAPFHAWAGAAMVRDLTPRVGRPGGLESADLDPARRWAATWTARAGIGRRIED